MSLSPGKSAQAWRRDLRAFIANTRRRSLLPRQEDLSAEEFAQFRVIGGELIAWYNTHFQQVFESRVVFEKTHGFDLTPFAVVLASIPGLVATQFIWNERQDTLVFLQESEFEEWTRLNPDADFVCHQLHWSYFTRPSPEQAQAIARRFPTLERDACRLHANGDLYGPQMGFGGTHLWQWNGTELMLVEEGFETEIY